MHPGEGHVKCNIPRILICDRHLKLLLIPNVKVLAQTAFGKFCDSVRTCSV